MWKFHLRTKWAIISVVLGLMPWFVHAQEIGVQNNIINTFLPLLSIIYSFVIYITFYALKLVTTLLDPSFVLRIAGGTAGSGGVLLEVWQFSRDIVNIVFALILAGAAFYAVLKADTSIIKSNINKFVLAIILVNFSWFGPRLVLDFANVATAAIYALPGAMGDCNRPTFPGDILGGSGQCWKIHKVIPYNEEEAKAGASRPLMLISDQSICYNESKKISTGIVVGTQYIIVGDNICLMLTPLDIHAAEGAEIMQGLLVNFTNIIYAGRLPSNFPAPTAISSPDQLGNLAQFLIKLLLNFSLTFVIAVPILAMTVIFFVRMLILWVTIAFMPFAFIGFLVGSVEMGNLADIWKHFWKNALLPAVLAVPFAIGFIMINGLAGSDCPFATDPILANRSLCDDLSFPIIGVRTWWELIWYIMALMVIYSGFFMATKFDRIAEKIGSVFKGWGDFALKAPLAIPIPIGPNGTRVNGFDLINPPDARSLGRAGTTAENKLKNNSFENIASNNIEAENAMTRAIQAGEQDVVKTLQDLLIAFKENGTKADFDKLQAHGRDSSLKIDINKNTIEGINKKLNTPFNDVDLQKLKDKINAVK